MKTVNLIGAATVVFLLISSGAFAQGTKSASVPTNVTPSSASKNAALPPKGVVTSSGAKETADAKTQKEAAIAGAAAAGVTVVGAGVAASTASAAVITSTIAAVGVGSMAVGISVIAAVPVLIGVGTYGAYRWFKSDTKE